MQYLLCGKEKGEKGTYHIQGYVQMKKRTTLLAMKKIFPRAHLESSRGTPEQNYAYCTKDGESHDHGDMLKGQGARSDLDGIKQLVDGGSNLTDIREQYYSQYMRYQRQIIKDIEVVAHDRTEKSRLLILVGPTGVGKSRYCFEHHPGAYWKSRSQWWDGYDRQPTVVIDDFYSWLPFDFMLRLCDRYPFQVEVKGGFRKFTSSTIIITSNQHYNEWWPAVTDPRLRAAFERRIDCFVELTGQEGQIKDLLP